MGKCVPCERTLRALTFALVFAALGWICTAAPAHAKNFNVATYGILPDGTDHTAAIQTLLATAAASPGSTVTFPSGTYIVSDVLNANGIKLVGQSATLSMVSGSESAGGTVVLSGSKPSVQNFTITDAGSNQNSGVYSQGDTVSVTGCTFNGWTEYDVEFYETSGNSTASGNTFNISGDGTGLFLLSCEKVTATGNTFSGPPDENAGISGYGPTQLIASQNGFSSLYFGIALEDGSYYGTTSATYNTFYLCYGAAYVVGEGSLTFSNNDVQYTEVGVSDLQNGGSVINDNSFNFSLEGGIGSQSSFTGVTAKGNTVVGADNGMFISDAYSVTASTNNINSTNNAFLLAGTVLTAKLTNNFINNCDRGISDQGSESVIAQNNSISGATSSAIYLLYNAGADTVSGNTLSNIGIAGGVNAAIDIESPSGTVSVTGNTYNQTSPYDEPSAEPAYYIYVSQGSPTVKNNKTNTMLGNFP